jgi:hypothetical protein
LFWPNLKICHCRGTLDFVRCLKGGYLRGGNLCFVRYLPPNTKE